MKVLILSLLACAAPGVFAATKPKANEYRASNCQGSINYSHNTFYLGTVNMDDTSSSVYLTTGQRPDGVNNNGWSGYSGKSNGGGCTGDFLGRLPDGCISLYPWGKPKIQCVSNNLAN